jgi:hypothetical protein
MKQLFIAIILTIIILNAGCGDSIVGPIPGSRNYVWTVDTITCSDGYIYPYRIWGNAPNDVWIACNGSSNHLLWHFDGTKWESDPYIPLNPTALWGGTNKKVWLGSVNEIWQHNEKGWFKYCEISPPEGFDYVSIEDINGIGDDLWGVGFAAQIEGNDTKGILLHYIKGKWKYVKIPYLPMGLYSISYQKKTGYLYIKTMENTASGILERLYLYNTRGEFKEILNSLNTISVSEINNEVYVINKAKIFKYKYDDLVLWKDLSLTKFIAGLCGRSENDFFGFSSDKEYLIYGICHYNGNNVEVLFNFPKYYRISGMMVFKDEIFIQSYSMNSNINLIVHGKLK